MKAQALATEGLRSDGSPPDREEHARALFPAWTAVCTLLLMSATWPLWVRPTGATFPQVPLSAWVLEWPQTVDYALSALVGVCLAIALVVGLLSKGRLAETVVRCSLLLFAINAAGLIILDQQRLQPWFYFTLLIGLIFGLCPQKHATSLARILVVSIYAFSAIGKLDYEFFHTVGKDFLTVLLSWFKVDPDTLSDDTLWKLTLALPLAELVLAGLLVLRWTRKFGGCLAALFHITLVLVFSPLGLGHSLSVILWNVQFAVQALLLFAWQRSDASQRNKAGPRMRAGLGYWLGAAIVGCAAVLPIGERLGLWDHWLSWALYAPHSSRTEVFVASSAVSRLPEPLRSMTEGDNANEEVTTLWYRVPLKAWCLEENFSPAYPQDRTGVGAAWQVRRFLNTDFEVKLKILGPASRFDGTRTQKEFVRPEDFAKLDNQFLFNTRPRLPTSQPSQPDQPEKDGEF